MTRTPLRRLLAAAAVAAVLYFVLSAHVGPQFNAHESMAGAAGLCLLVVTALAVAVVRPQPEADSVAVGRDLTPPPPSPGVVSGA